MCYRVSRDEKAPQHGCSAIPPPHPEQDRARFFYCGESTDERLERRTFSGAKLLIQLIPENTSRTLSIPINIACVAACGTGIGQINAYTGATDLALLFVDAEQRTSFAAHDTLSWVHANVAVATVTDRSHGPPCCCRPLASAPCARPLRPVSTAPTDRGISRDTEARTFAPAGRARHGRAWIAVATKVWMSISRTGLDATYTAAGTTQALRMNVATGAHRARRSVCFNGPRVTTPDAFPFRPGIAALTKGLPIRAAVHHSARAPTDRARLMPCGVAAVAVPADGAAGVSGVDWCGLPAATARKCGRAGFAHLTDACSFAVGEAKHSALFAAGAWRDDHFCAPCGLQFR